MKKALCLIIIIALFAMPFAGCSNAGRQPASSAPSAGAPSVSADAQPTGEVPVLRVAALKGPTTMGMVKLIEDAEAGTAMNHYSFNIGTTDETVPLLGKGEIDIAAIPANLASVIYNNTNGGYRVLAINTLGVLYLVEKGGSVSSVGDLKGRTVYSIGKGAVPEFAANYILNGSGLNPESDLMLEYKSEAAEILPLLMQNDGAIAVLQQPFVENALEKVEGLRVALDFTQEWDKVSGGESALVTGVIIVRAEIADKYPDAVRDFLKEYAASTEYTNSNPGEAAKLIEKHGIVAADIAEKAIPSCSIVCISGEEMKNSLSGYLKVLFDQNPQSVGGKLPGDEFYISD